MKVPTSKHWPRELDPDLALVLEKWHSEYANAVNAKYDRYADFSNSTQSLRQLLQTSTDNGSTVVGAIPNGTGNASAFRCYNSSNPDGAQSIAQFAVSGNNTVINAGVINSGTQGNVQVQINGVTKLEVETNGDVQIGTSGTAAMASGFPFIPAGNGPPTGTPTTRAGFVAVYFDKTNNHLYIYNTTGGWMRFVTG